MTKKMSWKICGIPFNLKKEYTTYYDLRKSYEELIFERQNCIRTLFREEITSYDDIYEKALPFVLNDINKCIEDSVDVLFDYDVVDVDADTFVKIFSDTFSVEESLEYVLDIDQQVCDGISDLASFRNSQKRTNGRWVGGGFGVKGAIAGVLTAGVLNAGASVLKGATVTGLKMTDKMAISHMKSKIYSDYGNSIINCFQSTYNDAYTAILEIVYRILVVKKGLDEVEFEKDSAVAIARNYRKRFKERKISKQEALEMMVSCKEMYPYHSWIDYFIFEIDFNSKDVLIDINKRLGFGADTERLLSTMYLTDDCKWKSNPGTVNNPALIELQSKQAEVEKICSKFCKAYGYSPDITDTLRHTLSLRDGCVCYLVKDTSWFSRGKNGFAITNDGFYIYTGSGSPQVFTWDNFVSTDINDIKFQDSDQYYIVAGKQKIIYTAGISHKDEFLKLVLDLYKILT